MSRPTTSSTRPARVIALVAALVAALLTATAFTAAGPATAAQGSSKKAAKKKAKASFPIRLEAKGTVAAITVNITVKKSTAKLPKKTKARLQYLEAGAWKTATTRRLAGRKATLTWPTAPEGVTFRIRVQLLKGSKVIETSKALHSRRTKAPYRTPPVSTPAPTPAPAPAPAPTTPAYEVPLP